MRQLLKNEVLDALRDALRDLENVKVSGNEPGVLLLRDELRKKIIEIENDDSAEHAYKIEASADA